MLNLGLNDETRKSLATLTGNERFSYDAYRRFIQLFGKIVLGIDSEKFERRVWDRTQADSLAAFIAVLNRARRDNPALQRDDGLRFLEVDNEQLLAYAKASADGSNVVVCVVNLDPHHAQGGWVEFDVDAFGLESHQAYQMHDLISDSRFLWHGARNYVSLDPQRCPVHVMRLRAHLGREHDFDYFL